MIKKIHQKRCGRVHKRDVYILFSIFFPELKVFDLGAVQVQGICSEMIWSDYVTWFPMYYKPLQFYQAPCPLLDPVSYSYQNYSPWGVNTSCEHIKKDQKGNQLLLTICSKNYSLRYGKSPNADLVQFLPLSISKCFSQNSSILTAFFVRIHWKNHLWFFMY